MLNIGCSVYNNGELEGFGSKVSFSDTTGMNFSQPREVCIDERIRSSGDWLWRATWHQGRSYATIYQINTKKSVHLIVSDDGINYKLIKTFEIDGGNETTLRFTSDHKMIAVIRRDGGQNGVIGISDSPYKNWEWAELESRLGGPDLILLENGNMICATREYLVDNSVQTILARVELNGKFSKLLTLPSGGDCSYPGLLMKDSVLFVSYYSSHEEKTAIYLAKVLDLKYGYDSFERVTEPHVVSDINGIVELSCIDDHNKIKYTLDGSIPTMLDGSTYGEPIKISKTRLLRAVAIRNKHPISKVLTTYVGMDLYQKPLVVEERLMSGLKYEYYEGKIRNTGDIRELIPIRTGLKKNITLTPRNRDANYAFKFSGYIKIPADGTFTFYLTSNDGSRFYLNNELVINNDGEHRERERSGVVSLQKGYHKIQLYYFQTDGDQKLVLEWKEKNLKRMKIPDAVFYH
jgi:hypothetical protein